MLNNLVGGKVGKKLESERALNFKTKYHADLFQYLISQ